MTTQEFYAHALLTALPIAVNMNKASSTAGEKDIAGTAQRFAEALTAAYKEHLVKEQKKQRSASPPDRV
jgi:hypothetical protein